MRLRPLLALLLVLAVAAPAIPTVIIPASAQSDTEMPPLPRPRPDPENLPASPSEAQPGQTPATDAITALTSAPQPVTLSARITPDGAQIPDGLV